MEARVANTCPFIVKGGVHHIAVCRATSVETSGVRVSATSSGRVSGEYTKHLICYFQGPDGGVRESGNVELDFDSSVCHEYFKRFSTWAPYPPFSHGGSELVIVQRAELVHTLQSILNLIFRGQGEGGNYVKLDFNSCGW